MYNLEKLEKRILVFLLVTLLAGVGVIVYKKLYPVGNLTLMRSSAPLSSSGSIAFAGQKKVNINKATVDQLIGLKGVGTVLAERIVEYRTKTGQFISIDDIKNVPGVGEKLFSNIKDNISLE